MHLILAVLLGTSFGFILHRVGASNPQNIINMLRFKQFHLLKALLLGVSLSGFFLITGLATGLIDAAHLSVKSLNWGVLVGGLLFGIGWALAGYCPGSSIAALADKRKDALFFVLGGIAGAFFYMIIYSVLIPTFLMKHILGGKVTLAQLPHAGYTSIIHGSYGIIVGIGIAILFFLVAWKLPDEKR